MSELMKQTPEYRDDLEVRRQAVMDSLTEAFAQGYLDMDSYELRADKASAATLPALLDELLLDLPPTLQKSAGMGQSVQYNSAPRYTNTALSGTQRMNTACVMGDKHFAGNWLQSDKVTSFTLMGSTKLDLTAVDLPPGPTSIEIYTLMGETQITVPSSLPVRFNVTGIMADTKMDKQVNQQIRGAAAWVEVSGFVMMGEVRVKSV